MKTKSTPKRTIGSTLPLLFLNDYAKDIMRWRERQQFITPTGIDTEAQRRLMLGKLMLVVTELAEAAEAVRHKDKANFIEELADAFIRLMDITAAGGLDMEAAIIDKMAKNWQRPLRNGKVCSL